MERKLLVLFLFCFGLQANSQCGTPPPIGLSPVYGLDTDNDGYAVFDIQYYIDYIDRPMQESIYGVSSSGYNFVFRDGNNNLAPLMYTSVTINNFPYPYISQEYTGSGPTFDPLPPCYWPIPGSSVLSLIVVPFDQDFDNDGILNVDEDTNHNGNLMDDDDDHDGLINLRDASNTLAVSNITNVTLSIVPNPITNGILTFESSISIDTVTIYDLSGKQLYQSQNISNSVQVNTLASGIYFCKFQSGNNTLYRKIIIR